jgi:hypothetical protein
MTKKAIEHIVGAYVRLENRVALENLMTHRNGLLADLKSRSGFDFSLPIGQIEEEIAVIAAGLGRLDRDGSSPPETELPHTHPPEMDNTEAG